MEEEKKDSKAALLVSARRRMPGKRAYWWLPFLFIFLFLIGGGFFASGIMRESAHKLGGGDNYAKFTSNNDVYEGRATVPKSGGFFASDEEIAAAPQEKAKLELSEADFKSAQPPVAAASAGDAPGRGPARGEAMPGRSDSGRMSMAGKLQALGGLGVGGGGGGGSRTSGASRIGGFNEGGTTASVGSSGPKASDGATKGAGGGVLNSLKGAFRASLYGARIASQDSAKDWTARSFDASPEATTAIMYNDKMRTDLDKVNPNSIPNFLREEKVSGAGATTLGTAEVSKPEALKGDEKKDGEDPEKKAKDELMSGMLNSIFSGLFSGGTNSGANTGNNTGTNTGTDTDKMTMNGLSDPNDPANTRSVDEFGYISYGDPNGMQYVYGPDGTFMGCTDNQAGWSIPSGSPGCGG